LFINFLDTGFPVAVVIGNLFYRVKPFYERRWYNDLLTRREGSVSGDESGMIS
jgi:hypothetical protein